ncbi:MAG TPA: hypothetical protein VFE23_00545 [Usitatibacter sp.]|jgi:uncharacterized protein YdeI (YjbR/CyaY-like superfamily)|nr:hypothetical protein [Usitatibacter sp.]
MATTSDPVLVLASPAAWRAWLRANHARSTGVLLRIPRAAAGKRGALTYATALEVALAWGWIDGQKRGARRDGLAAALHAADRAQRVVEDQPREG